MTETPFLKSDARGSLWSRALLMLVMAFAFQLAVSLLAVVAIAQLILTIAGDKPNERLKSFGRMLGKYLRQVAEYETFASDEAPFPFSDWPASK